MRAAFPAHLVFLNFTTLLISDKYRRNLSS